MTALGRLPEGWRLEVHDRLPSTNDEAIRLARSGAPEGLTVWAQAQTAGRGSRGRSWDSPEGNLFASVVLRPEEPLRQAGQIALLAAVALAEGVESLCPDLAVRCKWPNDLLLGGRKLGGLLVEGGGEGVPWLVLGFGLNVTLAPKKDDLRRSAVSLMESGCAATVPNVLAAGLRRLEAWLKLWRRAGFAPVRQAWMDRAWGLDAPTVVRYANETLQGTFAGLDEDGALLLRYTSGHTRRILGGDVEIDDTKPRRE
ncbi:MAG: biotin--[acetyl-CoA-carboxylase] ligase [Alphaproteobacteria bacterium RIFOXYD12_FULL_60_8]|nr:MAG: biotin--[acetyl-CoA-carboxylase] ligase [Alphaproteobacteria bacterium RIFOXYD12_FULL_60_8]